MQAGQKPTKPYIDPTELGPLPSDSPQEGTPPEGGVLLEAGEESAPGIDFDPNAAETPEDFKRLRAALMAGLRETQESSAPAPEAPATTALTEAPAAAEALAEAAAPRQKPLPSPPHPSRSPCCCRGPSRSRRTPGRSPRHPGTTHFGQSQP